MTVTIKSAIPPLVGHVQAYFTANQITANVAFGLKELTKQVNQGPGGANRVVFSPDPDGDAGEILPPRLKHHHPGKGSPRAIVNFRKKLIVSVWAVDTSDLANEALQYAAVEQLLEYTVQAVRSVHHADSEWEKPQWVKKDVELAFGRELRVALYLKGALFNIPNDVRTPGPVVNKPT